MKAVVNHTLKISNLIVALLMLLVLVEPGVSDELQQSNNVSPDFLEKLKRVSSFTVAILPMENMTVDPDIAYHFRTRISERLAAKGYTIVNNEIINKKLYELGVTHAGQLGLLAFEELKNITSADGFISGVVEQGAVQHAGVYNSYVYMCSMKLQNREGQVLWASLQNRIAKRRFALDPINALLDIALTEGGGDSQQAVYALADKMLSSFPKGPVRVIVGPSLLDMAVEVPVQSN